MTRLPSENANGIPLDLCNFDFESVVRSCVVKHGLFCCGKRDRRLCCWPSTRETSFSGPWPFVKFGPATKKGSRERRSDRCCSSCSCCHSRQQTHISSSERWIKFFFFYSHQSSVSGICMAFSLSLHEKKKKNNNIKEQSLNFHIRHLDYLWWPRRNKKF